MGADSEADGCCAKATVLHSLCRAGAKLIKAAGLCRGGGPRFPSSGVPVRRGPSPGGWRGRRKASGLPGAAEVGLIWGRGEGGSFDKALMRGLPAEGIWRKLTLTAPGQPVFGDLRRWNGAEWKRGPVECFTGWRWNGAEWNRLESAKSGPFFQPMCRWKRLPATHRQSWVSRVRPASK
jgi:hypothetical protein